MTRAWPLTLVLGLAAAAVGAQPADLVLVNGRVYTLDASRPWAEGVAITGGRITAVGTTAEMRKRKDAGSGTLTAGKRADVAVFDTDLVKVGKTTPADLLKAKVLFTIVGGKVVYEAKGPWERR